MNMKQLAAYAGVFKKVLDLAQTSTLAVCDLDTYLYVDDGLHLGVEVGQKVAAGTATHEVLEHNRAFKKLISAEKSVFGREYESFGVPVTDDEEKLAGAVIWAIPTNAVRLASLADDLLSLAEEVSASSETFAQSTRELALADEQLVEQTAVLQENMNRIDEVNGFISEIATESHILGINAAIEAARAKDYGSGFHVVAEEIRRLASQSKESAKTISTSIHQTGNQVSFISQLTEKVAQMGEEQSAGAQELSAAVQHISQVATSLKELSSRDSE